MYHRKKDEYIAGLKGHELSDWRSRFRALLLKYKDTTLQGQHKDYLADKDKAWHFLDQNKLYQQFDVICWQCKEKKLKIMLFEQNEEHLTEKIHEIISSWCKNIFSKECFVLKEPLRALLLADPICNVEQLWKSYLRHLEISNIAGKTAAEESSHFKKQILLISQRIEGDKDKVLACKDDLLKYFDLWELLDTEIFLILLFKSGIVHEIEHPNVILKRPDERVGHCYDYEKVTRDDLIDFYNLKIGQTYKTTNIFIKKDTAVTFKYAVENLIYKG